MARVLQALAPASLMLAVLTLAGCPPQPKLSVTPLAIAIGAQEQGSEFQITNLGGGTLNWTVSENLNWLQIQPSPANGLKQASSTIQGSLSTGVNGIELVVDRTVLAPGNTAGDVTVASNGGTQTVRVSVTQVGEAALAVSSETLNFGTTQEQTTFNILNTGSESLTWNIAVAEDAPWLSVTPKTGVIAGGGLPNTVQVTANRSGLAANNYTGLLTITSNAGTRTVTANMSVAPFAVTPPSLNFGALLTPSARNLSLTNRGFANLPLSITAATTTGGAWLSAAVPTITLASQATSPVSITANPTGLPPGDYTGTITVAQNPGSFSSVIPVTMSVSSFTVSNTLFDFGSISTAQNRNLTLTSVTGTPVAWDTVIPAADRAWLSVSPARGTVSTSQSVTVAVNPLTVDPGTYNSSVTFTYPGGSTVLTVLFSRPEPPSLTVAPSQVQLGTSKSEELIGIWNPGTGTINWSIDTTGFPAWLTLAPVNGSGIASGSVSGDTTDSVTVTVNRALAPPNVFNLSHTFNVVSTGALSTSVPVTVSAIVPQIPALVVETEGIGANNVNFINVDTTQNAETILIRNEGNGVLTWNIDPATVPTWIASIQPSQGNLAPNTQQTVTVTVNRATLTYLGAQATLNILSNDGDSSPFPVVVEVLVEKQVAITGRPGSLAFGPTQTSDIIEIANSGDPDTLLNFQITTTKEWLSVFPETGSSIGTASATKDFRPFSVTIDRSLLEGNGASGRIVVTAFRTENGNRVPVEGVEPLEIEVTAQAAELTIETTPIPYLRPPSIVRFPVMLRNVRYQVLPLNAALLPQIASQFAILENDVPLELTETAQIMRSSTTEPGSGGDLGTNQTVLIMLDYSGSMQKAASAVDDVAISGAADPIQALYERVIPPLLDTLGPNVRVGLGVFSERGGYPLRILLGTAGEPLAQQGEYFIKDRAALLARLQSVVVVDNGATQLFSAILSGIETFLLDGYDQNRHGLDFTDFPALLCFTDGRITTPPSPINDVIQTLQGFRIRYYPVGWGDSVASDPLVRLAVTSGGHYYSTRTQPTGEVDAFGTPLRKAVVSELEDLTVTDADECDQSIARDFNSLLTLSYITLNEQSNATIQANLTFDDPNDQNSDCLPEQGLINGSFASLAIAPADYAADNRLGQISMRSNGINPDGSATVTLRLEFVPRNVSSLSFNLSVSGADPLQRANVVQVSSPSGGVISDWVPSGAGAIFTYTSPNGPLTYGQYGDLLTVTIANAGLDCLLSLDIVAPVLTGAPDSKYFIAPDTIPLSLGQEAFAPALPTATITTAPPAVRSAPRSTTHAYDIALGTATDLVTVQINNIGGSFVHPLGDTALTWDITRGGLAASLISTQPIGAQEGGTIYSTLSPQTLLYRADRATNPGSYSATLQLTYSLGAIPLSDTLPTYYVSWTVLPPVLNVTPNTLPFGAVTNVLNLDISNIGQSTLHWSIDESLLPDWLAVGSAVGSVPYNTAPASVSVVVNRALLAPGDFVGSITVNDLDNPGVFVTIPVTVTVP